MSKLKRPAKWTGLYLCAILDVVQPLRRPLDVQCRERAPLATALFAHSCDQQQIERGLLTVRAGRGTAMRSRPVAFLRADFGVPKTHSPGRPRYRVARPASSKGNCSQIVRNRVSTMVVLTFDKLAGPFRIGETRFEPAAARPQPGSNR
jgi:hypothetical protein